MIVRTRALRHFRSPDETIREAFEIDGVCALATCYAVDDSTVDVWLDADVALSERQCVAAHRRVAWYLRRGDERTTPFERVCASILDPFLPPHAARCVKQRLLKRFGTSIVRDGAIYRAFPSARTLARAHDREVSAAGVPAAALQRLRTAIDAFCRLEGSPEADDGQRPAGGRTSANKKTFGSAVVYVIAGAYRIGEGGESQDTHCGKPLSL
ncbi:MAG: hypothetical protein JO322_06565 [Candidatus Eremiobacteraeota bacterium]|nr:hypothetical protein [Candidatus Eremiobacteraeota bacterium]